MNTQKRKITKEIKFKNGSRIEFKKKRGHDELRGATPPSVLKPRKIEKHSHLYYDILYPLWNFYHKWILHKGKYGIREWIANCPHHNPYDVLTPNRFRKQVKNIIDNNL